MSLSFQYKIYLLCGWQRTGLGWECLVCFQLSTFHFWPLITAALRHKRATLEWYFVQKTKLHQVMMPFYILIYCFIRGLHWHQQADIISIILIRKLRLENVMSVARGHRIKSCELNPGLSDPKAQHLPTTPYCHATLF